MLKEVVLVFFALVAFSLAYPAEDELLKPLAIDASPDQEALEPESLEGAESANPQWGWGRRGWGGGYGGGWGGRGWGGGGWGGRGWGGGGWGGRGWGGGWGGGWGRRGGYGWGR